MAVQADRRPMPGGFVGGGSGTRDHGFSLGPAVRALSVLIPRTTPARVRSGLITVVLLAACLAATLSVLASDVDKDFQAMGQRTEPEVTAATGLYLSLTDMDAQVANALLVGGTAGQALAAVRSRDLATYEQDRVTADADLQQAAVTAAGSPDAQRELRAVLDGLGQYEALASDALLTDARTDHSAGPAPGPVLAYYQQATDLMQARVLPQVTALTARNSAALNSAYEAGQSGAGAGVAVAAGLGCGLIAVLAAFQVYLALRFRRRLNPPFAAATLLAIVVTGYAWGTFAGQESHLRTARFSAFGSIIALSQARAVSYDANADESRYLVDPARAVRYQRGFLSDSQRLAAVGDTSVSGYYVALARDVSAYDAAKGGPVRFGGYLGAEFRNFTFPGEAQAAVRALRAYQVYQGDDRRFRALAARDASAATAFDSGTAPGQSDWAFGQYTAALSEIIAVNQKAFDTALSAGGGEAAGGSTVFPAAAALLAVLALAGARPRLAEYRSRD